MTGEKDPRDVMQAEHDAGLSEHPAFRAPAEMPGVEEIARVLFEFATCTDIAKGPAAVDANAGSFAGAILALFAPILAEMREIANAQGQQRFANLLRADAAEARALAAEADSEQWQNLFESTRASMQQDINRLERELASETERADMAVRQMIKQNDRLAAIRAQGE